jgi:hypothetical protein
MLAPELREHSRIEIVDVASLGADDDGDRLALIERSLGRHIRNPRKQQKQKADRLPIHEISPFDRSPWCRV